MQYFREQFIIYKCEILQSSLVLLNIPTIMRKVLLYWVRGFLESSATRIYLLRMYEIILRCTHGRILPLCKRKTFVGGFIIILPLNTFRSSWCKCTLLVKTLSILSVAVNREYVYYLKKSNSAKRNYSEHKFLNFKKNLVSHLCHVETKMNAIIPHHNLKSLRLSVSITDKGSKETHIMMVVE